MKVNMRDLLILLDCAKYVMCIKNQTTGWSYETVKDTYERVFNQTVNITLEVKNDD